MESSRVTCTHCDFLFYPEEGVAVDDCPVCGRTVEVKPAPAPGATCKESLQVHALPESVESALGVVALSDFPSVESVLRHHISDLTRRLAGAEAQLASREKELLDTLNRLVDERGTLRGKAEAAEAELAECKHELSSLRNTLDDLVAIQRERAEKAEAERDEARGRCERLREVAKAATDRLVCDASCPARITGAEVDCTCGLVAVYDALDAALAECEEVEAERDSEARWASQYAQESHAALSRAEAAEAKLKRYREALEEIAHGDACGAYRVEIARKALEVE